MLGFWHNRALTIAAELELADLLKNGPLDVEALAERSNTHAPSLFRLLRALESIGVFKQVSPRVFVNTPVSELLRKDIPGSQSAIVRATFSLGEGQYEPWAGLLGSIQTGKIAFDQIYGYSFWEFLRRNPNQSAIFHEAMRSFTVPLTPAITAAYDWSRFPVIADIGGGIGTQLVDILNAHPSCRGILFDQLGVMASAIPHDRIQRIGGSFFESVPAGADAYLLRSVIHDWAEPEAIAILEKVRRAMQPHARLVLIEHVIPETPELTLGKWIDLHMLVLAGGRERTATEYAELYAKVGFELQEIVPTAAPHSLIIGRPRP